MSVFESITWELQSELTDPHPTAIEYVHVDEALDRPYDIRLSATTPAKDLDVAELLGKDAALVVRRAPLERRFCGVVQEVEVEDFALDAPEQVFSLRIRPALFMLSMRRDSRIFQRMSVPEIVEAVLKEGLAPYEREVKSELTETYPTREYCVQYQETDLELVTRLLAEEGISYGFDHEGDKEIVVLRDKNASFSKVKTLPTVGTLPYHPDVRVTENTESVATFQLVRQGTTTKVAVRDNDFTREGLFFQDEEGGADARGRTRESYEHGSARSLTIYDYAQGVRRYQSDDAARQKKLRLELHQRDAVLCYAASSNSVGVAPGTYFAIEGHPGIGVDGEYLVTRTVHSKAALGATADAYSNQFECIPFETAHRPNREHAKPRIPSIQTAIVTGPAGEEIHVDEYGRIKVQFYWDRQGKLDDKTSCWVRTQQTWAGNGFGTWWVPRIGMEVIVQFIDGDPDRPLVTGCVYNADNALPYALPDEKTKSTIKSNSSIGGGGFNEFRFEDKKGQEEIWLHAQKDLNEKVLNSHTLNVGNCETIEIGVDQTQIIGNDQVEHVKANQTMTVDVNRVVTVGGNFDETITGNETRIVSGAVQETITSGETRTVNAGKTETVNAGETKTVNGGKKETVNGGVDESVIGGLVAKILGGETKIVVGGKETTVTGIMKELVSAEINRVCPTIKDTESLKKRTAASDEKVADSEKEIILSSESVTVLKLEVAGVKVETNGVVIQRTGFIDENQATKLTKEAVHQSLTGVLGFNSGITTIF